MAYETMILEKEGAIATITLNRPKKYNALNSAMVKEIGEVMDLLADDQDVKVVIITGGPDYFCAGADISEVVHLKDMNSAYHFLNKVHRAFDKIADLPKPVIASVSGLALGGGCEMALSCDLRIASEKATFGVPEINIGVLPGASGTQRLPRLLNICKAKEILFTGERITAQEAYQFGMLNKVVPAAELALETGKMAEKIAAKPPLAIRMAKHLVNSGMDVDLKSALKLEAHGVSELFLTQDKDEGMNAFLEKRQAKFSGR